MKSLEFKWGGITGAVYLVWLQVAFLIGLHSGSLSEVQISMVLGYLVVVFGLVTGLRALVLKEPETSFIEGLKSGIIMSGIILVFALTAWTMYFTVTNPGYTEYWTDQAKLHYEKFKLPPEVMQQELENAKAAFSMQSNLLGVAVGIPLTGGFVSAVFMAFVRRMAKR